MERLTDEGLDNLDLSYLIYFCVWQKRWHNSGGNNIYRDFNLDIWDELEVEDIEYEEYGKKDIDLSVRSGVGGGNKAANIKQDFADVGSGVGGGSKATDIKQEFSDIGSGFRGDGNAVNIKQEFSDVRSGIGDGSKAANIKQEISDVRSGVGGGSKVANIKQEFSDVRSGVRGGSKAVSIQQEFSDVMSSVKEGKTSNEAVLHICSAQVTNMQRNEGTGNKNIGVMGGAGRQIINDTNNNGVRNKALGSKEVIFSLSYEGFFGDEMFSFKVNIFSCLIVIFCRCFPFGGEGFLLELDLPIVHWDPGGSTRIRVNSGEYLKTWFKGNQYMEFGILLSFNIICLLLNSCVCNSRL
mmetsp:Transcript_61909/g.73376  ORF Transcript_61909/g.73376 Transcript_61909/m.73376 type:complete len:353 (-) Transcript_61909:525-1583(-)